MGAKQQPALVLGSHFPLRSCRRTLGSLGPAPLVGVPHSLACPCGLGTRPGYWGFGCVSVHSALSRRIPRMKAGSLPVRNVIRLSSFCENVPVLGFKGTIRRRPSMLCYTCRCQAGSYKPSHSCPWPSSQLKWLLPRNP